jgi:hypothetical protein
MAKVVAVSAFAWEMVARVEKLSNFVKLTGVNKHECRHTTTHIYPSEVIGLENIK